MKRNENQEAKRDKAKLVKNSGRGFMKGDATYHRFLLDYKHNGKSFTLTRTAWIKHRKDSWKSQYRYPCMSVVLGENSDVKVALVEWEVLKELIPDSKFDDFIIEYKYNNKSFTLTRSGWVEQRKQAWQNQYKHSCISVTLGEDSDVRVGIIEWYLFENLIPDSGYE